jgi:hypothetical protein
VTDLAVEMVTLARWLCPDLLARHETAHAVVAWQLGAPILSAEIDPAAPWGGTGQCRVDWFAIPRARRDHVALAVFLAGELGERSFGRPRRSADLGEGLYQLRDVLDVETGCTTHDRRNAARHLDAITGDPTAQGNLRWHVEREVNRVLYERGEDVDLLASRLLEHWWLDGRHVVWLLDGLGAR